MYLDRTDAYLNGELVELDVPPKVKEGRSYIPVRFLCESLGLKVEWQGKERSVMLTK